MNNTENKGFEVHVFSTSYPLPKTKLHEIQSHGIDIETKVNGELIEYYVETIDDANALIQLMREEL